MTSPRTPSPPLRVTTAAVARTWWPLAASWLLMGLELPLVSAVMARLASPTVSLAAYGGVVFPLALLIESPIVMLLAASTALSRDRESYRLVRRFMYVTASALTGLHALIAFTPLYDLVVGRLLHPPAEVLEPARVGLRIMLPWTLSIAYRRFQQGVLIRFDRSWAVSVGTLIRLLANAAVLGAGFAIGRAPGIVIGTAAVSAGVVGEAVFAAICVRPVRRTELAAAPPPAEPLTLGRFLRFYLPLAATPLFVFIAMPLASAAMSRMPRPLESLAAWPVVNGLVFTLRSFGFAMNEVVVSLLERPGSVPALRRFSRGLALCTSAALAVLAASPLGSFWFVRVSALGPPLASLAQMSLWIAIPMPALSALQSWHQGAIVHGRRTRGVTESVAVYLATIGVVLAAGIAWGRIDGLFVAVAALSIGSAGQVAWLWHRARRVIGETATKDPAPTILGAFEGHAE